MPDPLDPARAARPSTAAAERATGRPRTRLRCAPRHPAVAAPGGRRRCCWRSSGFAFVVQVRDTAANDTYAGLRESELIQVLDGLTGTAERARREVDRLDDPPRRAPRRERSARAAALDEAEQRVRTLNIIAGLVPVSGQGLRVTITESTSRVASARCSTRSRSCAPPGAEAMEFNDKIRLGADSSFENAVGGIELDDQLLESAVRPGRDRRPAHPADGAHLLHRTGRDVRRWTAPRSDIEELESVEITSVREPPRPEYAELGTGQ